MVWRALSHVVTPDAAQRRSGVQGGATGRPGHLGPCGRYHGSRLKAGMTGWVGATGVGSRRRRAAMVDLPSRGAR